MFLFLLTNTKIDEVVSDGVDMEACHLLLGRPCQNDVACTSKGKANIFMFCKDELNVILVAFHASILGKNHPKVQGTVFSSFE